MSTFGFLPIEVQMLMFPLCLAAFIEAGIRLGLWRRSREPNPDTIVTRDVAVGAMMALLGLVLAFTYSFSLSRADLRKQATLAEVNALSSAYVVARQLPSPERNAVTEDLLAYAQTRVFDKSMLKTPAAMQAALERTKNAQTLLWQKLETASLTPGLDSSIRGELVKSTKEILAADRKRLAFGMDRMPTNVRVLVLFVACVSLGAAAFNTSLGGNVFRMRLLVFAAVLSALVSVILDYESPLSGTIQTSQDDLRELIQIMSASPPLRSDTTQYSAPVSCPPAVSNC